jgi:hypothetical protein
MLYQYGLISWNTFADSANSIIRISMNDSPDSIVNILDSHAHLLVSREPSKELWADLATVQI